MKPLNDVNNSILKAFVENSQESIFITDGEGRLLLANDVAENLLSLSFDEMGGKTVDELMNQGYWKNSAVLEAIKSGKPSTAIVYPKNGDKLVSRCTPIFNEQEELILTITNSTSEASLKNLMQQIDRERNRITGYKAEIEYLRKNKNVDFIANSEAMKNVLGKVNAVAGTESTVVLYGESGTGKDVVANIIHKKSDRRENTFLSINCAAIPDNLIESELFGYEKGAFTGADAKGKIGMFEAAKQGTVFLDEIGDIPIAFQTKLLRVLENGEIRRVGATKNIPIDVRIICATNKDLSQLVAQGQFREDLYYRLNVFPIELKRLRDRQEDILPMAENFLHRMNEKYHTEKIMGERFKADLLSYSWPGNIRELRNIMERAYLITQGDVIDFIFQLDGENKGALEPEPSALNSEEDFQLLKDYTKELEKQYINKVLKVTGGNVVKAAEILGVHRSAIYRKLNMTY